LIDSLEKVSDDYNFYANNISIASLDQIGEEYLKAIAGIKDQGYKTRIILIFLSIIQYSAISIYLKSVEKIKSLQKLKLFN